jgi:Dipeptidyl peptidase IV (DPP IV) N-terminal region
VMDRDGSNQRPLFPAEGQPGLRGDDLLQPAVWSPDGTRLAISYQGNLWLVDAASAVGQQLTGDGQTSAYDWKP